MSAQVVPNPAEECQQFDLDIAVWFGNQKIWLKSSNTKNFREHFYLLHGGELR
jgi:hypothetical protein